MSSPKVFSRVLDQNATDRAAVQASVADGQLSTAAALRERLDSFGGAMLGDEVGAGKTFTTFAVLAEALLREPGKGAVVFAPSELLKRKWERQLKDYLKVSVRDRDAGRELESRVMTMDRSLRDPEGQRPKPDSIVITTHGVFSRRTSEWDRGVCLATWLEKRCKAKRKPWARLFRACGLEQWHDSEQYAKWASREVLTAAVLKPLDDLWARYEAGERNLDWALADCVQDVRRETGRRLLPKAALVVIDEAHNLKSTNSQVYKSLMYVLSKRFDALLFLTATPFQLGRSELRNIVEFFRNANTYAGREEEFDRRVAVMEAGMTGYVEALDQFGAAWRLLDADEVELAREYATGSSEIPGTGSRPEQAGDRFRGCIKARQALEKGLTPFLVRSVRERDHIEHCGLEDAEQMLAHDSRIPLALVDRIITELLADKKHVFVASALTSACSSWPSLFNAAVTEEKLDLSESTRDVLVKMHAEDILGDHPKVSQTLRVCRDGIQAGEKTLVFVERAATGLALRDALRDELGQRWDRNARDRLQDPTRFGWPSLRENYLHTLYPEAFGPLPKWSACRRLLSDEYGRDLWSRVDVDGPSRNYKVEKRFLEHVVFRAAAESQGLRADASARVVAATENVLRPEYVMNGLDLKSGATDQTQPVPRVPARTEARAPNEDFARSYHAYPSPWSSSRETLSRLEPDERAEIVDAAASAIASSHLQVEIANIEADGDPSTHFRAVDRLLCAAKSAWQDRFEAIATQAADLASVDNDDAASDRVHRLAAALRSNERVQFIQGGTKQGTRENAVDGFNTPLYPEIIIATPVLAEGLDLHLQCRRVVHHDLPWNPAKLEQRTGRVDRIGSLAERLAKNSESDDDTSIHVWLPYMPGTYDESIFDRVMARRREFRCVLGNRPEWDTDDLDSVEGGPAMDVALVEQLQVDLGP